MNDAHEKDEEMKKFKGLAKLLEFQYDEYILHILVLAFGEVS